MKLTASIFAAIILSGCTASASRIRPVVSHSYFQLTGIDVYSPEDPGWSVVLSDAKSFAIRKTMESPIDSFAIFATAILNNTEIKYSPTESNAQILDRASMLLQREKPGEKDRFKFLYFDHKQVSIKNTTCLKYKSVFEDHWKSGIASINFQYMVGAGYVCIHPYNKNYLIRVEYSLRSKDRDIPDNLGLIGEKFFSDMEFTERGL